MSEYLHHDIWDPWWQSLDGILTMRRGYFAAMDELEVLSRRLSQEAHLDYVQRLAAEPPEQRREREERSWVLRDLVIRANDSEDTELWRQVDELVFGPGART